MQEIYSEFARKVIRNRGILEKELKVKITHKAGIIFVEGKAEDEYVAIEIIEAINLGFKINTALLLTNGDFIFEKIYIKDITKRRDLERVRGRVIGTNGKTKRTIESLGECFISLHDNTVGIIGRAEDIEIPMGALAALIRGKKQTKTYSYLERQKTKEKTKLNEDLGLKTKE